MCLLCVLAAIYTALYEHNVQQSHLAALVKSKVDVSGCKPAQINRALNAVQMSYKDHEALFQTNYFGVVSLLGALPVVFLGLCYRDSPAAATCR